MFEAFADEARRYLDLGRFDMFYGWVLMQGIVFVAAFARINQKGISVEEYFKIFPTVETVEAVAAHYYREMLFRMPSIQ